MGKQYIKEIQLILPTVSIEPYPNPMSFTSTELDFLFPLPSNAAFTLPGASAESAEALVRLLKQDFVNFHCFFNEKRFHKSVTISFTSCLMSLSLS